MSLQATPKVEIRGKHRGRPVDTISIVVREPELFAELEPLEPGLGQLFDVPPVWGEPARPSLIQRAGSIVLHGLQAIGRRVRPALQTVSGWRPRLPRVRRDARGAAHDAPPDSTAPDRLPDVPSTPDEIAAAWVSYVERTLELELPPEIVVAAHARVFFDAAAMMAEEPLTSQELVRLQLEVLVWSRPEFGERRLDLEQQIELEPDAMNAWLTSELRWDFVERLSELAGRAAQLK